MWVTNGFKPPSIVNRSIGTKKAMFTVIWSPSGMKSITMLPQDMKFTKNYFTEVVFGDLQNHFKVHRSTRGGSGITIHIDNAPSHRIDDYLIDNGFNRMEHPPYSPDLAPSDFFLFGYLKQNLEGMYFNSFEELLEYVTRFLNSIPIELLHKVYLEWMERLQKCIDSGGEYVE